MGSQFSCEEFASHYVHVISLQKYIGLVVLFALLESVSFKILIKIKIENAKTIIILSFIDNWRLFQNIIFFLVWEEVSAV